MKLHSGEAVVMRSQKYKVDINNELRERLDDLLGMGRYKLLINRPKVQQGTAGKKFSKRE
ncbi:MAG: hypothetical protein R3C05_01805 [Pirellulaceae bacterium]